MLNIFGNVHAPKQYIIGSSFMQSHYIVFDMDEMRVGINGETLKVENLEKKDDGSKLGGIPIWALIMLLVIGMGALLAIIAMLCYKYKYRKLRDELRMYDTIQTENTNH